MQEVPIGIYGQKNYYPLIATLQTIYLSVISYSFATCRGDFQASRGPIYFRRITVASLI